jgi:hypothetical protein
MPAEQETSAKFDGNAKRAAIAAIWIRERDGVKNFQGSRRSVGSAVSTLSARHRKSLHEAI